MLRCGIDWDDLSLHFVLLAKDGSTLVEGRVKPNAEGLAELFATLEQHAPPDQIAIAIESTHGPWVQALLDRGYIVYPINPKTADHFRKAMSAAGDKSDSIDRRVLATMLGSLQHKLRPLQAADPEVVALRIGCEDRVRLVEERTAKLNELLAALKTYYPAAVGLFGDRDSRIAMSFLVEFPTQRDLQSLTPGRFRAWLKRHNYSRSDHVDAMVKRLKTPALNVAEHLQAAKAARIAYLARSVLDLGDEIKRRDDEIGGLFESAPESDWILSLPGAGPTLGPALFACIGRDVNRFEHVSQAQAFMGTAPVTKASGQSKSVFMRRSCWKFARRTLQFFADHSRRSCAWAAAYYTRMRERGNFHHAALRALAHKWLKIILAMQRSGQRYDEALILHSRERYLLNAKAPAAT